MRRERQRWPTTCATGTRRAGARLAALGGGLLLVAAAASGWAQSAAGSGAGEAAARFRGTGRADLIRIERVSRRPSAVKGAGTIAFDLAWDHSWRAAWEVAAEQHGGAGTLKLENWDAAWVFVKFRKKGADGWAPATLSPNPADHAVPAGAALEVGLADDPAGSGAGGRRGVGVFIYRSAPGSGPNLWKGVTLRWLHAADGVPDINGADPANAPLTQWLTGAALGPELGARDPGGDGGPGLAEGADDAGLPPDDEAADFQVQAIQMVYVPRGAFWVGDGVKAAPEGSEFWAGGPGEWEYTSLGKEEGMLAGQFTAGGSSAPFRVESEGALVLGGEAPAGLGNNDGIGMRLLDDFNRDRPQALPAAFPKGFAGFYCMRHEITQGQYVAFLNTVSSEWQARLYAASPADAATYRHGIRLAVSGKPALYRTAAPYVACNWLSWGDGVAYAAWAGLRPMTEFEFEKAARGPLKPVPNECAWGTDRLVGQAGEGGRYALKKAGLPDEAVAWSGAGGPDATRGNVLWPAVDARGGEDNPGPLRVGIFATPDSDRVRGGASYWGILDLSGSLTEAVVTVGAPNGRRFAGTHGAGLPTSPAGWGFADEVVGSVQAVSGFGWRGGSWSGRVQSVRVSSRYIGSSAESKRAPFLGFRAVRTAPGERGR